MLRAIFMMMALMVTLLYYAQSSDFGCGAQVITAVLRQLSEVTPDVPNANEHYGISQDTSSIEVLEYAPPMYKIKATMYNAYQSPRKHLIFSDAWTVL